MRKLKDKADSFFKEFNSIKTENEGSGSTYMDKIKRLIEEGEEHIKDIDSKIPKDLKTVKQDIHERMSKLRFMIKENFRNHKSNSENYEFINKYLDRWSTALKKMKLIDSNDEDSKLK